MVRGKRQAGPPPCIVVFGEEELLVREAASAAIVQVFPEGVPDLGIAEFDPADAALADVLDELRTLPFLADRRLVLIRGADAFISKNRDALERYLDSPSPTGVLLLICKTFDARTRLYKAVGKCGQVVKCQKMYSRQIPGWVVDRATSRYAKRIDPPAAARLRNLVGDDLATLDGELDKLSVFVGDRPSIAVADVEALVGYNREEKVFGIIDAMATGEPARALELWHQVWATDRAAVGRAIGGLAFSIRRLLEARRSAEAGSSIGELARTLWADPETVSRRLKRCTVAGLQEQLSALLEADVAAKTGWSNVRDAVEKFIVAQCLKSSGASALPAGGSNG